METNYRNTNIDNLQTITISNTRSLLASVFMWMTLGLVLTSLTSMAFSFIPGLLDMMVIREGDMIVGKSLFGKVIGWAPLVMIIGMSFGYRKMSYPVLAALFLAFSAVLGIGLSYIFIIYQIGSIVTAFFSATALFGTMAAVGYFTKTDLTKLGSILMIGLFGIVIAMLINYFVGSSKASYIISIIAVIIFTGLTAYDMQKIKNMVQQNDGSESFRKLAVWGALDLYLDFINLFLHLLNIFGKRN